MINFRVAIFEILTAVLSDAQFYSVTLCLSVCSSRDLCVKWEGIRTGRHGNKGPDWIWDVYYWKFSTNIVYSEYFIIVVYLSAEKLPPFQPELSLKFMSYSLDGQLVREMFTLVASSSTVGHQIARYMRITPLIPAYRFIWFIDLFNNASYTSNDKIMNDELIKTWAILW
jgi:hypothetical protein